MFYGISFRTARVSVSLLLALRPSLFFHSMAASVCVLYSHGSLHALDHVTS